MGRKIRLWITGFFLLATLASLSLYFTAEKKTYSDQTIRLLADKLKANIIDFLEKNNESASALRQDFSRLNIQKLSPDFLEKYALSRLKNHPEMHGIVVFGPRFHFLFARDNATWATTYDTVLNDTLTNWVRVNNQLEVLGKWTDTYNYFIDEKSLDKARKRLDEETLKTKPLWKVLLDKGAAHNDYILSSYKIKLKDGTPVTFAFVYAFHRQKGTFSPVSELESPMVSFVTSLDKVTLPLSFSDSVSVKQKSAVTEQIDRLLNDWEKSANQTEKSYLFLQNGKRYWMHVSVIPPSLGLKAVSIATTENGLKNLQHFQVSLYGYLALIFGILAFLGILSFRKKKKSLVAVSSPEPEEIKEMIAGGEDEHTEFKSSLRWDYREQKVNPALETVILKSIAAFANAKGGKLLIGVNDAGEILGLEPDFKSLKKKDADGFELHLRRLIKNQFGISFTTAHVQISFPEVDGKTLCLIRVSPSHHPLYLKTKTKNGNDVEKFYVRMGNASQEIASLREIHQYIKNRFD